MKRCVFEKDENGADLYSHSINHFLYQPILGGIAPTINRWKNIVTYFNRRDSPQLIEEFNWARFRATGSDFGNCAYFNQHLTYILCKQQYINTSLVDVVSTHEVDRVSVEVSKGHLGTQSVTNNSTDSNPWRQLKSLWDESRIQFKVTKVTLTTQKTQRYVTGLKILSESANDK